MMETISKKYIQVISNSNNTNYILINFYYYKSEDKKGYYLSIQPIHREEKEGRVYTEFMGFSGYKYFLLEVARKSKKAENQAKDIINNNYIYEGMLKQVLEENNLMLVNENDMLIKF